MARLIQAFLIVLPCIILSGCMQPIDENLYSTYNQTSLGQSSSGDVLVYMESSHPVYISQADTVIASWNEDSRTQRQWLNMAAFDEDTGDTVHKYFFFVDEKARVIPAVYPKAHVRFDAQLVLDKDVLEKTYADENLRSIAILRAIQKQFGKDVEQVLPDNKKLGICQMVVNESMNQALLQLSESPALAIDLKKPQGFDFDSLNLVCGNIYLHEEGGIATIDLQIGAAPWFESESQPGRAYEPSHTGSYESQGTIWSPNAGLTEQPYIR